MVSREGERDQGKGGVIGGSRDGRGGSREGMGGKEGGWVVSIEAGRDQGKEGGRE